MAARLLLLRARDKILPLMKLGVHISIAGGFAEAVGRAKRLGCTTMQLFSRSPRGGAAPALSVDDGAAFDALRRRAGIDPLAVHAPYIINLASPEPAMWRQSLRLYQEEYRRAARLGAQFLVTHVGSHRGEGEALGIRQVAAALNRTLDGADAGTLILLENTAGSGQGLGERFEQLAAIRSGVTARERVGVCLDTAHLFAAGYPIHTAAGLEETVAAFDAAVGLSHVRLIHLNDSKVPFGAKVDRHWHIGQGHIGLEAFGRLLAHSALRELPFILETPKSTEAEDRRNLSTVRKLIHAKRRPVRARARALKG